MKGYLKREIRALCLDAPLIEKFLEFATNEGRADIRKFRPRLLHVLRGRTPSAYIALLLVRFFHEKKYENFVRTVKDHIEYITSDGDTSELEAFIRGHPLALRVVRVRMTNWVLTGKPNNIDVRLRTPIGEPDPADLDEKADCDQLNKTLREFQVWLWRQADIPESYKLRSREKLKVRYNPDWLRYSDEEGFESQSDFHGSIDVTDVVQIVVLSAKGAEGPYLTTGKLDTFYQLAQIFDGTQAKPAPRNRSFQNYWPRIVESEADFPQIFLTNLDRFPPTVQSRLTAFFAGFAKKHSAWVKRALKDMRRIDAADDEYVPTSEEAFHYDNVKKVFFRELLPELQRCWPSFCTAALSLLEKERVRAREHFENMKKHFG